MLRGMARIAGLIVVFGLALAAPAVADTTLGSTSMPAGSGGRDCDGAVIAQLTSDPSTPYAVPSPPVGPLASWQVNTTGSAPGTPVTLLVLRSPDTVNYTVIGADTQAIPSSPPGGIATFTVPTPIAVAGGDTLALYAPSGTGLFACYFRDGATPVADSLISLNTGATPVVGQGLARDDSSGGGYTLNLAATLKAPVVKKKCKKHKKKRSADSAKKKKCKKKKKG
jgi:hypothetical protein